MKREGRPKSSDQVAETTATDTTITNTASTFLLLLHLLYLLHLHLHLFGGRLEVGDEAPLGTRRIF